MAKGKANKKIPLNRTYDRNPPDMLSQLINAIYSEATGNGFSQFNNPLAKEPFANDPFNTDPNMAMLAMVNDDLIKGGSKQAQVEQLLQTLMKSPRYSKYGHPGPIR